jgi:hypothetical protein
MNTQNKSITLLFNPFFYIAGLQALALGLSAIFLAGLIGSWGHAHFDGVLDLHIGAPVRLWLFFCEGIIDWLCLSVVLWVCGKILSQNAFRAVDLFGTQALARWPAIVMSLLVLPKAFQRFCGELVEQLRQGKFEINPWDAAIFVTLVIVLIPFLCWMVALMYKSFSVSCNVKGGKAIGTFIAGLLVAEIISKLCVVLVLHQSILPMRTPARPAALPSARAQAAAVDLVAEGTGDLAGAGARFVDLLVKEDFAGAVAQYDSIMASTLPEAKLREVWRILQKQAGPFQKRLGTRVKEEPGFQIVFVPCQFERAILDIKVVFDSQRCVAGLFYGPSKTASSPLKSVSENSHPTPREGTRPTGNGQKSNLLQAQTIFAEMRDSEGKWRNGQGNDRQGNINTLSFPHAHARHCSGKFFQKKWF